MVGPPTISGNGSTIVYGSNSSNLHSRDTDTKWDVFARRLATHTTELVSINTTGTHNGESGLGIRPVSADGNRIAFSSTSTSLSPLDVSQEKDIYVRDLAARTTTLVSVSDSGTSGANGEYTGDVKISADSSKVAFTSSATNLHPLANGSRFKLFVRDLADGVTHYIATTNTQSNAVLSTDGDIFAFVSEDLPVDPLDTNRHYDVYVSDLRTGELQLVSRHAGSASIGNGDSVGPLISANGEFVAFSSYASNFHPHDYNGKLDVFLATITWDLPELAGDFNRDGNVDAADYSVWRNSLGQTGLVPYSGADGDGDGTVEQDDYAVWKAHFWGDDRAGGRERGAGSQFTTGGASGSQRRRPASAHGSPSPHPLATSLLPHPLDNSRPLPKGEAGRESLAANRFDGIARNPTEAVIQISSADFGGLSRDGALPSRGRAGRAVESVRRLNDNALLAWCAHWEGVRATRRGRYGGRCLAG